MSLWTTIKDKLSLKQAWQSCQPGMNVTDKPIPPRAFAPYEMGVKILVAQPPSGSQKIARAVMKVQEARAAQFEKDFPNTKVLMSLETFHDNCRHGTPWSDQPSDIGSAATRWRCFQTATRFREALRDIRTEGVADIVIMVGDRFSDDVAATQKEAAALFRENGTRIFALPSGADAEANDSFKAVAESGHGLYLPLLPEDGQSETDYAALMKEVTQAVFFQMTGQQQAALPAPETQKAEELRKRLQQLKY